MKREDFWTVFIVVLAAALLWIVFHVFWGQNGQWRNIDLGIHQRTPVDSRGYRSGDAGAVDSRKDSFFTNQDWLFLFGGPSTGESFVRSPVAKIRDAMDRRAAQYSRILLAGGKSSMAARKLLSPCQAASVVP